MKKLLSVILSLAVGATFFTGASTFATKDVTVELDGKAIEFDVKPEVVDGRTMVPLRKIFEEIGASVKWNDDTQTVSARKNSKTITLAIDSAELKLDKGKTDAEGNPIIETVTLDVPAQLVNDRTLVPARAVSESFGLKVDWDEKNQKVIITSEDEEDDSWKENVGSINLTKLTYEGKGIEIAENKVKITQGGDYTLNGTLDGGNIIVSTKEKVKLRLNGVKITSESEPCIFVEDADKAYITIADGSENYLIAKNSEDGAIYSKENLEIKGDGSLEIVSDAGHGIKASDNLNIENGNITINAESDGIHINDTFKMLGGTVNITALGDGIDCESIVKISGGTINIETNGKPVETTQIDTNPQQGAQRRGMWMDEADVEFEKSTKGINAEWMMTISGGEININSASHAVHCQDEMEISGGKFTLSSKFDKGISAHGNLTISGSDTVIDITKSTEGLESKNVLTINDGVFNIVSDDDAINATGGKSGVMMPGGNFGGNGQNGQNGNRNPAENPGGALPNGQNNGNNQQNPRPGRETNGQNGGARPESGTSAKDGTTPPANGNAGGVGNPFGEGDRWSRAPRFNNAENGEGTPKVENGGMTPPLGSGSNGGMTSPFGSGANGGMMPPMGNGGNGGIMPPMGNGGTAGGGRVPQFGNGQNGATPESGNRIPMSGGMMNGGGFMGGGRGNAKTCLIINGGDLNLCGNDDCIDANGSMVINGGVIKAANPSGAFTGNFGVLDADGQVTIGENANVILSSRSGSENSLRLSQNAIIIYCEKEHSAGDEIKLLDEKGNVVYEFAPSGSYRTVLIASKDIKTNEKYTITIGDESFETQISKQSTVIGTQSAGGMGFGMGFGRTPNAQ